MSIKNVGAAFEIFMMFGGVVVYLRYFLSIALNLHIMVPFKYFSPDVTNYSVAYVKKQDR